MALLLLLLGGGGGFLNTAQLRALIHDEVARSHNRTACRAGFWMAMLAALALYVLPWFQSFTGQQVSYVVLTLGTATFVEPLRALVRSSSIVAHGD